MQPAVGLLRNRQVLTNSLRPAGLLSIIPKNPSVNYRRFSKSSPSLMPTPLTPEIFVSPDRVKTALAKPTMMEIRAGDEGFAEVPIPESVRNAGVIPEGYSVGSSFNGLHLYNVLMLKSLQTLCLTHKLSFTPSRKRKSLQ